MSRYYYKISDGIEDYINATDMSSAALEAVQTELTRGVKFSQGIVAVKVRAEGDSDFSMILKVETAAALAIKSPFNI